MSTPTLVVIIAVVLAGLWLYFEETIFSVRRFRFQRLVEIDKLRRWRGTCYHQKNGGRLEHLIATQDRVMWINSEWEITDTSWRVIVKFSDGYRFETHAGHEMAALRSMVNTIYKHRALEILHYI